MPPNSLADILAPISTKAFFAESWGQKSLYVKGASERFAPLLPWAELNRIITEHRLEPPRLRLAKNGESVPPETFLRYQALRRGGQTPRLNSPGLINELRNGATLILDAIDEMCAPIADLTAALERELREGIQVNAYAGWKTSRGFDVHWDDHDVIVLQIAGQKDWKIYGATREYPLYRDTQLGERPTDPLWEQTIGPGDFLYIPRGWWHVATPRNEPSLHLTFGITNRTAIDYVYWLTDRLRAIPEFRRDIPKFSTPEELRNHSARLLELLETVWSRDDLTEFLADEDAQARPSSRLNLPWVVLDDILPSTTVKVRFNGRRSVALQAIEAHGAIELKFAGKVWRFSDMAEPILRRIMRFEQLTVSDLAATPGNQLDMQGTSDLISQLCLLGIVSFEQ